MFDMQLCKSELQHKIQTINTNLKTKQH